MGWTEQLCESASRQAICLGCKKHVYLRDHNCANFNCYCTGAGVCPKQRPCLRQENSASVLFIPYISSAVALAAVFKAMFRENGAINMILTEIFSMSHGLSWFSDFSLNKIPIIIFVIWSHIGFELIVYMAALQNVPKSLYEAADLDGASSFKNSGILPFQ